MEKRAGRRNLATKKESDDLIRGGWDERETERLSHCLLCSCTVMGLDWYSTFWYNWTSRQNTRSRGKLAWIKLFSQNKKPLKSFFLKPCTLLPQVSAWLHWLQVWICGLGLADRRETTNHHRLCHHGTRLPHPAHRFYLHLLTVSEQMCFSRRGTGWHLLMLLLRIQNYLKDMHQCLLFTVSSLLI